MPIDHIQEAIEILRKLAERVDPYTGEICPPDTPYESIQLASALHIVLEFVEENLQEGLALKAKEEYDRTVQRGPAVLQKEKPLPIMQEEHG